MEKYQKKPVVSRDEQLIRAALEMAVAEVENDHFEAAVSIRFIDPAEVLARLPPAPDAVARLVEAARAGLNYLENTEGEFGITLGSATGLRAALAAMEASHDRT